MLVFIMHPIQKEQQSPSLEIFGKINLQAETHMSIKGIPYIPYSEETSTSVEEHPAKHTSTAKFRVTSSNISNITVATHELVHTQ